MKNTMRRAMWLSAWITAAGLLLWKLLALRMMLSLFITAGTVCYHMSIRLIIGFCFDRYMNNRANLQCRWYQTAPWEMWLYQKLRVRQWKGRMPVYDSALFDLQQHTWTEIAGAMCQAELVHEVNAAVSFVPLLFSVWVGAFPIFLITSIIAAGFDLLFAVIQRYNRPRVMRLAVRTAEHTGI